MEVRGQEKGYNRDSTTVHGDAIFNPSSQTLDHDHHLLYHHHHQHHQLNPPPQDTHNRPIRDPDTDSDPVPAPVATTSTDRSTTPPTTRTTTHTAATATTLIIRYRECLRNHAASMGGHVVDGCGEFMPAGEEGTQEALKCAACDCHRNFHRKETDGANSYYYKKFHHRQLVAPPPPPPPFNYQQHNCRLSLGLSNSTSIAAAPVVAPLMMAFGGGGGAEAESSSDDLNMFHSNAGGQSSSVLQHRQQQPKYSKKRFRTKFNQEQKEKMMELAEKINWRIQKQDEEEVQEFCAQVGIKRQVFKVWMHNNKQQAAVKKKEIPIEVHMANHWSKLCIKC
ncbi:hypothetical protein ACOSQ2_023165 [Xanthoceras sorbifolium]